MVAVQSATGNVSAKIGMLMNPNARKRMAEPRAIRRFVASGVGIQSTRIFSRRSDDRSRLFGTEYHGVLLSRGCFCHEWPQYNPGHTTPSDADLKRPT